MTTDDVRPNPCPTWTVTTQKVIHVPTSESYGTDVFGVLVLVIITLAIFGVILMAVLGIADDRRR